ncbi:formimidoylglutamate deiminase [Sciscionella marina]|uniref:formimidoylglutamate deiminase n=1 Tax=Sciscionella marina TaxID=508770 RepID=UPI0003737106|nr:formimidoylglutamate deiminase [Sciscionella marina]
MRTLWCERAWLPSGITEGVLLRTEHGRITEVTTGAPRSGESLSGLVFPGFANTHSHAFHRALRGHVHGTGTFWSWRETMYALANRLDPDSYYALARAVYAEMVLAGFTAVGEFHYLHHDRYGRRYADPNAMGEALRAAAAEAGIRLTLLDTCYLAGGIGAELSPEQARFGDGDAQTWAQRVAELRPDANTRIGAAIHSVRAVPREQLGAVRGVPLHVHLSEQPAENEQALATYGRTPTELLAEAGALGPETTTVHATHLSETDLALLGEAGVFASICPTTEADLADGIGPARELADAGATLVLGTDQHVRVDPFAELRGLEYGERLRTGERGRFTVEALLRAATVDGHAAIGWDTGGIAIGSPCDLVAVDTASRRTAGSSPQGIPLTASAADVHTVIVGGETMASKGKHERLGEIGPLLAEQIGRLS